MGFKIMPTLKILREMAMNIGRSFSLKEFHGSSGRQSEFKISKNDPVIKELTPTLKVHKKKELFRDVYNTNDHSTGETLHTAKFENHSGIKSGIPFKHDVQVSTDRVKSREVLPKGHATNIAYSHFKHSEHPLKSSDEQYDKGHEMWHRLVHRALDDVHHVYHWDGDKLHKTNKSNAEEHLSKSFGKKDDNSFENKHMILSKKELI